MADEKVGSLDSTSAGIYVAYAESPIVGVSLLVKGIGEPAGFTKSIQHAVWQVNPSQAIDNAFVSHLATRAADAPLTLDGVAAAIRDDSRFALVRDESMITVESGDRFFQLTDGVGSYAPAPTETLRKEALDVTAREGGV